MITSKDPSDDDEIVKPTTRKEISKKYLMSEQEIKQNEIIEAIFKKFDSDGSGALDIEE